MTSTVLAYLDAGSANAIVTLILGGLAGIGVALKQRWRQLLVLLHIKKPLAEEEPQPPAAADRAGDDPAAADRVGDDPVADPSGDAPAAREPAPVESARR